MFPRLDKPVFIPGCRGNGAFAILARSCLLPLILEVPLLSRSAGDATAVHVLTSALYLAASSAVSRGSASPTLGATRKLSSISITLVE